MSDTTTLSSLKVALLFASVLAALISQNPYELLNSPTATINLFIGVLIGVIAITTSYLSLLTNPDYKHYDDLHKISLYFDFCFVIFMLSAITPIMPILVTDTATITTHPITGGLLVIPLSLITAFTALPPALSYWELRKRDTTIHMVLWNEFTPRLAAYASVLLVSVPVTIGAMLL